MNKCNYCGEICQGDNLICEECREEKQERQREKIEDETGLTDYNAEYWND